MRTYTELVKIQEYLKRYEYLKIGGEVGKDTFGFERYLNQSFYRSAEWKQIRDYVIVRDNGCDMGVAGHEIFGRIYVHHMNPIQVNDILHATDILTDPEYLICVSQDTHNAIHFGDISLLPQELTERRPNDTCPWKTID